MPTPAVKAALESVEASVTALRAVLVEPEPPPVEPEPGTSPLATMKPGELLHLVDYTCDGRIDRAGELRGNTTWDSFGGWVYDASAHRMLQFSGAHSVTNRTDVDALYLEEWPPRWESLYPSMTCEELTNGEALLDPEGRGFFLPDGDREHPHPVPIHSYDQCPIVPMGPDKIPHLLEFSNKSNPGHCKDYVAACNAVYALPLIGEPVWKFGKAWGNERGWYASRPVEYDPPSGLVMCLKSHWISFYDADADDIVARCNGPVMNPSSNLIYFPPSDCHYLFNGYAMQVWEIKPNRDDLSLTTWREVFPTGNGPEACRALAYDSVRHVICGIKDGIWYTFDSMTWTAQEMPQHVGRVADHALAYVGQLEAFLLHTGKLGTPPRAAWAYKPADLDAEPIPEEEDEEPPVDEPEPVKPTNYIALESGEATRSHYHTTAAALWKHEGGDWIDAEGTPQGDAPFAQGGGDGEIRLDVSSMLSQWTGILLRASTKYFDIFSPTGEHPPHLLVDGLPLTPRAFVPVYLSTAYNLDDGSPTVQANSGGRVILMDFDIPEGASTATLFVHKTRGVGEVQAFRIDAPTFNPWLAKAVEYGIGKGKTIDELDADPDVIATWDYREGWEDKYPRVIDGIKQAPFFERANVNPVLGVEQDEHGEWWVHTKFRAAEPDDAGARSPHHVNLQFKATPERIDLNETGGLDSVYFQYKFKPLFDVPKEDSTLEGGKFPGIDYRYGLINPANGGYWQPVTGNGGTSARGLFFPQGLLGHKEPVMAGGSIRGQFVLKPGPEGPYRNVVALGSYMYHPRYEGGWGDTQMWEGVGLLSGVEYVIEHFMQVNTVENPDEHGNGVGQPDGKHKIWVNGRLVRDVDDMVWTHNPYMNPKGIWGLFMHGGSKAPQSDQEFKVGAFVVARKYIGPRWLAPND